MMILAATLLTLATAAGHTDTTVTVRSGTRLEVSNFMGEVSVSSWDRDAVHVLADHGDRTRIELEQVPGTLSVKSVGFRGVPGSVDLHIVAPSWMRLDISGPFTDVNVDGFKGNVKVETVRGDVNLNGGGGYVELSSVSGDVSVAGASGHLKLSSINQDVTATRVSGQMDVETVNGDVVLENVQLQGLDASSVSGDVWFNGPLLKEGRYQLESHSGNISVVVPDRPNANVSVSTFSGDFSSDFDFTMSGTNEKNRRMQFMLGSGGPQLDLQSFNGSVQIVKASTLAAARARLDREDHRAPQAPKPPRTPKAVKANKAPKDKSSDSEDSP
jgi:hypothetical protein